MGNETRKINFNDEYIEIMKTSDNTVVVKTEWNSKGDFFEKLSLYDESYQSIKTLGSTTLIKK